MTPERPVGALSGDVKRLIVTLTGAARVGITSVAEVAEEQKRLYREWIEAGKHAGMNYMERYGEVRDNPALLLDGAKSIIVAAFSYANPEAVIYMREREVPRIAEYALGSDYHNVLRKTLTAAARRLTERYGGEARVCADTAPLRERYWAQKAGVGFIGRNNYLIVPGQGAHFYLGTILWTGSINDGYDSECDNLCYDCGRCVKACPNQALSESGGLDARRCLSYHTIESREDIPCDINLEGNLFGCDICRNACPHQHFGSEHTSIEGFVARPEVMELTYDKWRTMTTEEFDRIFANSALRRAKLHKLQQTLGHLEETRIVGRDSERNIVRNDAKNEIRGAKTARKTPKN